MTEPHTDEPAPGDDPQEPIDQDAEPTMTAPPEDRPDAGGALGGAGGRADSPDVVDTDDEEADRSAT